MIPPVGGSDNVDIVMEDWMSGNEAQSAWVSRVLGINIPISAGMSATAAAKPMDVADTTDRLAMWRDAKEDVDAKISALVSELRTLDDPDFDRIADFGLFGATSNGENVTLNKALREYGGASAERRDGAAKQLRTAIAGYRTALGDPMFRLIDDNPFGIAIGAIPTLGGALNQIEQSLA